MVYLGGDLCALEAVFPLTNGVCSCVCDAGVVRSVLWQAVAFSQLSLLL